MSVSVCRSVSQNFDICRSHSQSRMFYNPTPETRMADCHLALSVDLGSINAVGLLHEIFSTLAVFPGVR